MTDIDDELLELASFEICKCCQRLISYHSPAELGACAAELGVVVKGVGEKVEELNIAEK